MTGLDGFVFAAGLGTRMGPLSTALPKAAWTIRGKPLLRWAACSLWGAGCRRIACNAHLRADVIKSIAQGLEVLEEQTLLGTGAPLRAISGRIPKKGLLVWNADVIADVPWAHLQNGHLAGGGGVTWLLLPHMGGPWTELYMDLAGRVLPRGVLGPKGPFLFTGAACWSAAAAKDIPENCFDVRDFLAEYKGHVGVVAEPFRWLEIGTPDQLIRAAGELAPEHEGRIQGSYVHATAKGSDNIRRCVLGPGAAIPNGGGDSDAFWFWDGLKMTRMPLAPK